ncbi:MAG: LacI family DNA-binding transcriptional regulator [Chloroflexi bacterium]|nr:LacI family DNA-binding transcriptional regulator [Chloroflexota bacterium]
MATGRRSPTLESVAAASGVSRQTVSNVINAPDRVAPPTRARVQSAIESLNYSPNRMARSLRTRASRAIGFCVPPAVPNRLNPVLDRFVHAIADAASARGFHVLLFTAPAGPAGLDGYAELMAQQAVDGFALSETVVNDERQAWLMERGIPFVAFGRTWNDDDSGAWVDVDGAAGVAAAVDHVHGLGHRRIAFLGWPRGSGVGDDRLGGYLAACERLGVPSLVARGTESMAEGHAMASRLLGGPEPPTALVCVSDTVALGALRAVARRNLAPGRDVAVVGFDDTPFAALPGFELTSLSQPIEEAGRTVVRMLLKHLERKGSRRGEAHEPGEPPATNVLLRPTLVIRSSTDPEASRLAR